MERPEFEALVDRLDALARRDPAGYRARVMGMACLGYGYLALLVLLLLLLTALAAVSVVSLKALGAKLAVVIGGFLWVVLRSLWIRLEPPEGTPLVRGEAPELFAMLDRLRQRLDLPRIHRVLLTDEFNAGAAQVPRLGLFGWHRQYLLLGLPLMQALTPAQFEAVLAHELGHLAGGHGRLGNWIYRLRLMWERLNAALQAERHWGTFAVKPFFEWYVPRFSAWSFPLARANEYEADAASARLVTARTAAQALCGVQVAARFLDQKYWPGVHAEADRLPAPAFAPFAGLGPTLAGRLDPTEAEGWLRHALQLPTTHADTHPALGDRLAALGQPAQLALPAPGEAADRLLGRRLDELTRAFDERWRARIEPSWQERHRYVQRARERLTELQQNAAGAEPAAGELLERALLQEDVGAGPEAALAELRDLHARHPDDSDVAFSLGKRLLARDDADGLVLVERALEADGDYVLAGAELLRDYWWRRGDKPQADAWQDRLTARARLLEAARAERAQVFSSDKFDPHGLDPAALATMVGQLRAVAGLRRVYLVRKRVRHLPESPLLVLGFEVTPFWQWFRQRRADEVQQRLLGTVGFPAEGFVFCVEGPNRRLRRRLSKVAGSRVL